MLPVDAKAMSLQSGIITNWLGSNNDGQPYSSGQSMKELQQKEEDASQDTQIIATSNKGKEPIAQDHSDGMPHGAKKLKQQEGVAIDINKALQQDDGLAVAGSPSTCGRKRLPQQLLLKIKKRENEIDAQMLELEEKRMRWAKASRKRDMELEKMKLENGKMRLENEQMWLQLKIKERDLNVKSKRV